MNRFTDASNGLWQGHLSVERNASNKRKPDEQNISRRTKTMTDLIYRGIAHTGTKATPARTAQALTYRGVAHDGLATPSPKPATPAQMCYRGVRYGAGATGAIMGTEAGSGSRGGGAAAPDTRASSCSRNSSTTSFTSIVTRFPRFWKRL